MKKKGIAWMLALTLVFTGAEMYVLPASAQEEEPIEDFSGYEPEEEDFFDEAAISEAEDVPEEISGDEEQNENSEGFWDGEEVSAGLFSAGENEEKTIRSMKILKYCPYVSFMYKEGNLYNSADMQIEVTFDDDSKEVYTTGTDEYNSLGLEGFPVWRDNPVFTLAKRENGETICEASTGELECHEVADMARSIEPGEKYNTVLSGEYPYAYYSYTPEKTGVYNINFTCEDGRYYGEYEIYSSAEEGRYSGCNVENSSFSDEDILVKGVSYLFVIHYSNYTEGATAGFYIEEKGVDAITLNLGESYAWTKDVVYKKTYFQFTPEESGFYALYGKFDRQTANSYPSNVDVWDNNGKGIHGSFRYNETEQGVTPPCYMEAGITYLVEMEIYVSGMSGTIRMDEGEPLPPSDCQVSVKREWQYETDGVSVSDIFSEAEIYSQVSVGSRIYYDNELTLDEKGEALGRYGNCFQVYIEDSEGKQYDGNELLTAGTYDMVLLADGQEVSRQDIVIVDINNLECDHDFEFEEQKDGDCSNPSYELLICTKCGEEEYVWGEYGDHVWEEEIVKEASCSEEGKIEKTCTICELSEEESLEKLPHKLLITMGEDATCTKPGKTWGKCCSVCGEILEEQTIIPALGHQAVTDAGVQATCTEPGKTQGSHCSVCGEILEKQTIIPALGHQAVTDAGVQATCTEPGKTQGSHCSVCGETIEAQTTIPALGHSFTNYVSNGDATALADGTKTAKCDRCGAAADTAADIGSKLKATIKVTASSLTLKTGQKFKGFKVTMEKGDYVKSWKSNKTSVVKVSGTKNGTCTITAQKKTGTAKITVTLASGTKKTVKVKVQKAEVKTTKISVPSKKVTLKKGKTYTLKPVIAPVTSLQKITYKSSNTKIAAVNKNGKITAKKKGKATITVMSGSKSVKVQVTVKN